MIGVIADDLTGAAEIGAVGLRHGLRAEIILLNNVDISAKTFSRDAESDLLCVDTDSRSCDANEATKRAAAAAKFLKKCGAQWFYKKTDSVLRGQVTAEIEAVMKQLKFSRTLLLPANPSLGRTIQNGKYFVRGKPIHKTEFARDPYFPRRSANVLEMIKRPPNLPVQIAKLDEPMPEKGISIAEAATSRDVADWAAKENLKNSETLFAGGAEFFGALLVAKNFTNGFSGMENFPTNDAPREFFISGTSTLAARKFASAARRGKIPVFSLPQELSWGSELSPEVSSAIGRRIVSAFDENPRVILTVGLPPVRDNSIAQNFSDHVAQIAESALRGANVEHIFAEGGATAAALVRRMGWSRLKVLRELAPGVATLAVENKNLLFTIKPGSYAWPAK
jgi:uncharacterized protein YgbK (DUF1537 family)